MNSIRIDRGAVSKNLNILVLVHYLNLVYHWHDCIIDREDNTGEHPALRVGRLPSWICYKMFKLLVGSGGRVRVGPRVGPPLVLLLVRIVIYSTVVD